MKGSLSEGLARDTNLRGNVDKNGRLGDSYDYTLTDLPADKKISMLEGFVNPYTFANPRDDDPCYSNTLRFRGLDNTAEAATITVHLLVERERTQTVRRNRHRQSEITSPEIECLPTSLLPLEITSIKRLIVGRREP